MLPSFTIYIFYSFLCPGESSKGLRILYVRLNLVAILEILRLYSSSPFVFNCSGFVTSSSESVSNSYSSGVSITLA